MARETVENVKVNLTVDDKATKPLDQVAKKADEIEAADPTLTVTATDAATPTLQQVDRTADAAAADRELTIRSHGMGDILDDLRAVQSGADDTKHRLEGIGDGAEHAAGATVDGLGRVSGGLAQIPGPIGEIGQAFNDAADLAEGAGGRIGGALQGIVPIFGVVAGAAFTFWNMWQDQADQAKKKLEEVKAAQLAMASGDIAATTKLLADQWDKYRDSLTKAGISQGDFAKIVTTSGPLTGALADKVAGLNAQLDLGGVSVDQLRDRWAAASEQLTRAQSAQFEMAKALGATTDELMAQASNALPAVRAQILQYIGAQAGIPESKLTTVLTDADPDDVAQVKKILDDAAKERNAPITASADTADANAELDAAARTRTAVINVVAQMTQQISSILSFGSRSVAAAAAPGPTGPAVRGVPAAAGGGGSVRGAAPVFVVNQVSVHVPVGYPTAEIGRYVADALDAHERRSGSRRRAVA